MSDILDRRYNPLKLTNTDSETIPAFGAVRPSSVADSAGEDRVYVRKPDGDVADGLIVNSGSELANGDDGWGRPTQNGMPFWVRAVLLQDGIEVGDEVGPVDDSFHFSKDGNGYKVLKLGDGIIECVALTAVQLNKAEMIEDLYQGASTASRAWLLKFDEDSGDWERTDTEIMVWGDEGFKGVLFGRTTAVDIGDICDVFRAPANDGDDDRRWYALVGGWYFHGKPLATIARGASGSVQLDVGVGAETREITVTAFSPYEKALAGSDLESTPLMAVNWNTFSLHWDIHPYYPPGCGLKLEDDEDSDDHGKVVLDESIAGCGLTLEDCELSVDNTAIAGTGLSPEGDCAVGIGCENICERIIALEECCEENRECCEILTEIIVDLIECCEDSRECCYENALCCYENTEAIDYIAEYCCDDVPGTNDCGGRCLWRWNGSSWDNIVPCAGPDDCGCPEPLGVGTEIGDLESTDCSEGGGGSPGSPCCDCEEAPTFYTVAIESECLGLSSSNTGVTCEDDLWSDGGVTVDFNVDCNMSTLSLTLRCTDDQMKMDWSFAGPGGCNGQSGTATASSVSCDPVEVVFTFTAPGDCCCAGGSDTVTVTLTKTP